jgi:hypothetical protein
VKDEQLHRENLRREVLKQARRDGLKSANPTTRTKWQARDEAWTRSSASPDGGL